MEQTTASTLRDIRELSLPQLEEHLRSLGEKPFRARQIWQWIWQKGVTDFEMMTNLAKPLREKLSAGFAFYAPQIDTVQYSEDGTIKTRLKLHDGHLVETVLIPVPGDKRFTVCVSCQVGCSLTCSFCATGRMKRIRNLTTAEIYDQVVIAGRQSMEHYDHPITNVVYMGMGEPLLAYAPVIQSIARLTAEDGLNMSPRRITLSTAGIAKMIRKLADDGVKFNLAISLHAANDAKRNTIMPINETNNLAVLMEALRYFFETTRNRITYEYIAFHQFNTGESDARELIRLCRHFPVRVNIIEYNPIDHAPFVKAGEDSIDRFAETLKRAGVMVTVRRSRGKDIDAACGQLANK